VEYFLKGLYPMQELSVYQEIDHTEQLYSPLTGTAYEAMLKATYSEKSPARNILRIPTQYDTIINHKENEVLRRFLLTDKFNIAKVEEDLKQELKDVYEETKKELEMKYKTEIKSIREYFDISDLAICELGFEGSSRTKDF
jgi:hypothetical protein